MNSNELIDALSRLRIDLNFLDDDGIRLAIIHDKTKITFSGLGVPIEELDESKTLIHGGDTAFLRKLAKVIVFLERTTALIEKAILIVPWESAAKAMNDNSGSLNRLAAFLMSGIRVAYGTRVDDSRVYFDSLKDALTFAIDDLIATLSIVPPKKSRVQPYHEVTAWVRKNWRKYGYDKSKSVRGYIAIKGKRESEFKGLRGQVTNDCRKRPLQRPENRK